MEPSRRKQLFDSLKKISQGATTPPLNRCSYWVEEGCSGSISSHSLSKCWLETISFQGHVVKVKIWPREGGSEKQLISFSGELIGQNDVSVFQGFCNKHDTELFRNLDALTVEPTPDDCMKLMYRSAAREFAVKHHVVATFLAAGMGKDRQAIETLVFPQMIGAIALLDYKLGIEAALSSGDFSDYEHLVFSLKARPPFLGSTTFTPLVTSDGRLLEANQEQLTLTLLPTEAGGLAVLSWKRTESPNAVEFAQALRAMALHLAGIAIAKMLFEMSDNVVFSPVYWYGISEESKLAVVNMHARSIVNHERVPPANALVPNEQTDKPFALDVQGVRSV